MCSFRIFTDTCFDLNNHIYLTEKIKRKSGLEAQLVPSSFWNIAETNLIYQLYF